NLTPDGFTRNITDALAGLRCADTGNPGRDLLDAISLANSVITGDVLQSQLGARSRTKYVVILLANGRPTVSLAEQWCAHQVDDMNNPIPPGPACDQAYFDAFCADLQPPPTDCERAQYVNQVRSLKSYVESQGAQQLFFHIVYQRDPDAARAQM